ncbi:NTP transferase domain-containing protein [Candidatus Woesearchaeota archaeon]|nr:NTP transferase domain-containing protein [Candidatus Woesearchaeota archaeon]
MQAVILAGGLGTRLRPLTNKIPKPMIEINGKPFLEYLILYLRNQSLRNILILTGYMSEKVISYFKDGSLFDVKIKYSNEKKLLGTGGALKNAQRYLNKEFVLLNGDTFIPLNYHELIDYYKKINKNIIVVNRNKKYQGNIMLKNRFVVKYDKVNKNLSCTDCGVQIFRKDIIKLIPKNKYVSLENEIFPLLINKKDLIAFETKENFFDLGTFEGVDRFKGGVGNYFKK